MDFTPFPLGLLAQLMTPLAGETPRGFEMLPFMRWLNGHLIWRQVAIIEDGRDSTARVLETAIGPEAICRTISTADWRTRRAGPLDFIHITAETDEHEMAAILHGARLALAKGGLVLAENGPRVQAAGFEQVNLAIGGGISLLHPEGERHALIEWLTRLPNAEVAELCRLFDTLGATMTNRAEMAALQARLAGQRKALQREQRGQALLQRTVDRTRAHEHLHYAKMLEFQAECVTLRASTSWRITAPLRETIRLLRRAMRRTESVPSPTTLNTPPGGPGEPATGRLDDLTSGLQLHLPQADDPVASILVDLQGSAQQAYRCLRAIADAVRSGDTEVIVTAVDPDESMLRLLAGLHGARFAIGPAANAALEMARGNAVLLLDANATLAPGTLEAALETLLAHESVGAVGAKIIASSGALVQAGEIIFGDGTVHGVAKGKSSDDPEVQFRRVVESCSGGFLLVRLKALIEIGGLSPAFAHSRQALPDLCIRLASAGWRTIYEPRAVVTIDEQRADTPQLASLFQLRHASSLGHSRVAQTSRPLDSRASEHCKRILIIDDRLPYPELGSGYPRASRMLHELHGCGWSVTFFPNDNPDGDWDSVYEQFPREIEFMLDLGRDHLARFLAERRDYYDVILVSRPHNMRDYLTAAKGYAPPRLVYDAEAVFATREFLRMEQAGQTVDQDTRRAMLAEEIGLAKTASVITAVNQAEADMFRQSGCADVTVLGLGVEPRPIVGGFFGRRDLLFVGALDEDNAPNADAVRWFVQAIMPDLDARIGSDYRLILAGRCGAPSVRALASRRVHIMGLVDDLTELYASARVFVAPTRFAAGLPLKVQEAVGRGLPVVATGLLARQLGWHSGAELLAADSPAAFADCCARLYQDSALWQRLRRQGLDRLVADLREHDFSATLRQVVGEPAGKSPGWWCRNEDGLPLGGAA